MGALSFNLFPSYVKRCLPNSVISCTDTEQLSIAQLRLLSKHTIPNMSSIGPL